MARPGGTRRRDPREQDGAVRLAGVVRRSRRGLLLGTALQATVALVLVLPARAQLAPNARPVGGVVVGGAASISRTPGATNIDQSSQRAAVNWQSFDVGAKQAVNFQQPNAAAVVLNRVTGPNPSQIAGQINANGQVILENQDGITFLKGAQINTAGLVATAAGITTKNFMAGHMVFDQPAAPNAAVVNEGRITVRQAGIAALVAPQVANSGVITAKLGRVVLAGAETATLDLYGDGLVSIDVNGRGEAGPGGSGRQAGNGAGHQHRNDHRRRRAGAADGAAGRRAGAEPGGCGRDDRGADGGRADRPDRAERDRRVAGGGGRAARAGQPGGADAAGRSR